MSRAAVRARPWLLLALLGACDRGEKRAEPHDKPNVVEGATRPKAQIQKFVGPLVAKMTGQIDAAPPLVPSARVPENTTLTLASEAHLALDFANGARVSMEGPARLTVGPHKRVGLLVRFGFISVDYPQHGGADRLWVGAPAGRFWVSPGGRAAFSLGADAMAYAAIAAGNVTFEDGVIDLDQGGGPKTTLTAGETLRISQGAATKLTSIVTTLELAERLARGVKPSEEAPEDVRLNRARDLDAILDALTRHDAEGRSLLQEHARLVASKDPKAAEVQRLLAVHAAASFRLHEAADVQVARAESTGVLEDSPTARQRAERLLKRNR